MYSNMIPPTKKVQLKAKTTRTCIDIWRERNWTKGKKRREERREGEGWSKAMKGDTKVTGRNNSLENVCIESDLICQDLNPRTGRKKRRDREKYQKKEVRSERKVWACRWTEKELDLEWKGTERKESWWVVRIFSLMSVQLATINDGNRNKWR